MLGWAWPAGCLDGHGLPDDREGRCSIDLLSACACPHEAHEYCVPRILQMATECEGASFYICQAAFAPAAF